jgi:type II secretory ATPase GspE/PulE/Tfp pilus assembly ATPase PilB-like protein
MSRDTFHLGRLAVHYKLITPEQLSRALEEQAKGEFQQSLGDYLVAKGLLTPAHVEKLLGIQQQMLAKQAAADAAATSSATGMFDLPAATVRPSGPAPTARAVDRLLDYAVRQGASDLRLATGERLLLRRDGALEAMGGHLFAREEIERFVAELLDGVQREQLDRRGQTDFSASLVGMARFRGNAFRFQNGVALVLRAIPFEVPNLSDLGLPSSLARLTAYHQGIVLLTGPAGSGKSSTLAALLNLVNEERTRPHRHRRGSDRVHPHAARCARSTSARSAATPRASRGR